MDFSISLVSSQVLSRRLLDLHLLLPIAVMGSLRMHTCAIQWGAVSRMHQVVVAAFLQN